MGIANQNIGKRFSAIGLLFDLFENGKIHKSDPRLQQYNGLLENGYIERDGDDYYVLSDIGLKFLTYEERIIESVLT